MPIYASSDMMTRNVEVHSRNIIAREPRPADFAAAAAIDIERRGKVGTAVGVMQMIGEVVTQIKQAIAADKKVCCH
jgi:hypothetical protein